MKKSINVILGNHNHQPVGNFDFAIENVYNNSYKPFLDILKDYPSLKFVMHYTGCLFNWLEDNHSDHIDELAKMVASGNIEICSSAYYEPILAMISDRDKAQQILKLNDYIKSRFNQRPRGMWLAERVWEQSLTSIIANSNLEYVILDDSQFAPAAIDKNNMYGYFSTDNGYDRLNIFPISQALRYYIPFKEVDEAIEYLASMATEEGDRLLVLHDDGEKYGEWPGTSKWVYEDKWLVKFFETLEREKDWIHTTTYSEYMDKYPPINRVYLPAASYEEMTTWVLPAKEQNVFTDYSHSIEDEALKPFVRGGFWRNFMTKYSESNRMQKHMMYASSLVHSMLNGDERERAKDYLFKSQCNCPYWHGTFGGLYLNHLRHATYKNAIEAIRIAEKENFGDSYFRINKKDFDKDGRNEYIVSSEDNTIIFDEKSASIVVWDVKSDNSINIIDTFRRREEAYHKDIFESIEQGDSEEQHNEDEHVSIHEMKKSFDSDSINYLVFDKNEKVVGVDHFLSAMPSVEDFAFLKYEETGSFANANYTGQHRVHDANANNYIIEFISNGNISGKGLTIKKSYDVHKDGKVDISVEFKNTSAETISTIYAMENNFTLLAADAEDRFYYFTDENGNGDKIEKLSSMGEMVGTRFGMKDEGYTHVSISIDSESAIKYLYTPFYTISDAINTLERIYQGSSIVCLKELTIEPNAVEIFKVSINVCVDK